MQCNYVLHGHILEQVQSAKYLGVTLTHDLRWHQHVMDVTAKANRTLSFLRRNLRINSEQFKCMAYTTLVRPLLEYSCTVWDPYTKEDIRLLEGVQRRAARYVLNRYHYTASVSDMLKELGWKPLEVRRQHHRMNMMYKIINNLAAIDKVKYLTPPSRSTRYSSGSSFIIPHSGADYHKYSFFSRSVKDWNSLPTEVVSAPSIDAFKKRLESTCIIRNN